MFACLWEHGWRLRCTHTMRLLTCLSVVVCVVPILWPCLSCSGCRDRCNSGLLRSGVSWDRSIHVVCHSGLRCVWGDPTGRGPHSTIQLTPSCRLYMVGVGGGKVKGQQGGSLPLTPASCEFLRLKPLVGVSMVLGGWVSNWSGVGSIETPKTDLGKVGTRAQLTGSLINHYEF